MAETRWTLIDKDGIEESRATTAEVFKIVYEPLGYVLGFSADAERKPYSDASLKALERGAKKLQASAKERGIPLFVGPEVPNPNEIIVKDEEPKVASKAKAEA
jgi:hypothetical protein